MNFIVVSCFGLYELEYHILTPLFLPLPTFQHFWGRTDIERLEATTNFAKSVIQSQLPQSIQDKLFTVDAARVVEVIQVASRSLSSCLEKEAQYRQAFFQQGKPDAQAMFGSQYVTNLRLEQIADRLDQAVAASDDLPAWINYHRAYQQVTDDGMQPLVEAFEHDKLGLENLEDVYQVIFYRSLLRFAYQQHPELNQLSGINQAQAREQFQRADKQLLSLYQKQLVAQLAQASIEPGNSRGRRSEWTNLALIQNEINKQKRHISQRDLFQRASVALQQLKPCWMMSPASVAQFIPPGAVTFDMVIIDEASQMRPEEALGSIARAKQLVVVGDPKQLPPTDFFKARFDQDAEEDSGEEADILDDESILDMSLKVFYPARRLKWHYRSRHESLIAFSNRHFYDNSLTIFPSPNNQFAVEYQYIETGAYRSGANVPEAMRVAEAAADFMRQYPHLSLGIVTLNQKQQELLLDEMDRLFALHPELEQYRVARENTLEPFFVKNLENVQGDERDVIFISTVYGPERPGMPVMQRFGPINSRNGHRRLNVLFTRAKERVVVFSSMKSSDIRPSPTTNRGVQILKEYLEYAQTQRLQTAVVTGREPDSDFEIFVAERLRQQGYEVVPQVGVSGYFIDLAVVDPERPGTYLLGIECDGATYHSSKAARDRLRQQVLERLGWKLYRIWSTDWFTNSTAEAEKLITYVQRLLI
ncbi:AAA domain-containing protein [Gloeomargaritales cyanobacterium VI4D9]|nr:AAA domain-containing protein [Gloeomargaritales cyanobacterium VI4D9]